MTGKRAMFAAMLSQTGLAPVVGAVRKAVSREVTVLAYHRVLDVQDEQAFPFDIELVSAGVDEFAWQMEYLKKHFYPTTFAEILDTMARGKAPRGGSVVVTFDDGFDDNYVHAYPILKVLDMPATIFLSTEYIDQGTLMWYERLAFALMRASEEELRACGLWKGAGHAGVRERRAALDETLREMKRLSNEERLRRLAEIFSTIPAADRWREDGRSGPLTWDQVREMAAGGIEFGSHTVSHPILSRVGPQGLRHELVESKRRIEEQTGITTRVLAYPVGGPEAFDEGVRREVRRAGYELAVSYIPGVDSALAWDRLAVPRLHVERYVSRHWFRGMVSLPAFFS